MRIPALPKTTENHPKSTTRLSKIVQSVLTKKLKRKNNSPQ